MSNGLAPTGLAISNHRFNAVRTPSLFDAHICSVHSLSLDSVRSLVSSIRAELSQNASMARRGVTWFSPTGKIRLLLGSNRLRSRQRLFLKKLTPHTEQTIKSLNLRGV